MPHTFIHSHMSPILLYASVCSKRHLHVVGVVGDPLHVGHLPYMLDTSPIWGMPPHMSYNPTHWLASLCICMFGGISAYYMGNIPLMFEVWGWSPHMLGVWGSSTHLSSFGAWQCIHWVSIMLYLVCFL